MALLVLSDLKIRYGPVEAVKGVNLSLEPGTITVLLGSNGAGKSTTINAIMGLVKASAGSIHFNGEDISQLPPERISMRGIGLSPEGRRVFAGLSVVDNLLLGGAAHAGRSELRQRLEAQYARFPILGERRSQKAGLLSGGEQQMLAIARVLMAKPRLLLLDEPSLGLAPKLIGEVFRLVEALRQEGLTILLVEQNVRQSLAIADQGAVLANGRLSAIGPAAVIAKSDMIRSAYLAA
jgi:branched-chain amino acid transport system ATP-binding protein